MIEYQPGDPDYKDLLIEFYELSRIKKLKEGDARRFRQIERILRNHTFSGEEIINMELVPAETGVFCSQVYDTPQYQELKDEKDKLERRCEELIDKYNFLRKKAEVALESYMEPISSLKKLLDESDDFIRD